MLVVAFAFQASAGLRDTKTRSAQQIEAVTRLVATREDTVVRRQTRRQTERPAPAMAARPERGARFAISTPRRACPQVAAVTVAPHVHTTDLPPPALA